MRFAAYLVIIVSLTACGEAPAEVEQRAGGTSAAEAVRAVNRAAPPLVEIIPEPIEADEIEANDLAIDAYAFAPGTNGAVRLVARESDAVIKLEDELIRFAADPGSRPLLTRMRTVYNGTEFSLRLAVEQDASDDESGSAPVNGILWVYDRWDRVVYNGTGTLTCTG